ncbi:MAG: TonB-dependent receptor, partial [Sphingopyxis sp.]
MTIRKSLFAALTSTTCIVGLAVPAAAAEQRIYKIEAGSLEAALEAFGRQSGEQVLYKVDDVKDRTTRGVAGMLTAGKALQKLLEGTGLRVIVGKHGALAVAASRVSEAQAQGVSAEARKATAGTVVDGRSGAPLKGAFVELVGSSQSTATDESGRFRFAGVTGARTVRISYLGFPAEVQELTFVDGRPTTAVVLPNFEVSGEIVVTGYVSARAQALNQERTADNTQTVISSDLLGNFNGTTLSDALRRAPGVSFQQNPITGDGENITVRGVTPAYNQVLLNGVALQQTNGSGRAANLNTVLASSVSEIRISKTLLPDQDSAGTGGLIEIETKSPLDRPRRYIDASIEQRVRGKGYGDDLLASASASGRFGTDGDFGISASYQYRRQDITSRQYQISSGFVGPYLPLDRFGNPVRSAAFVDPRTPYPFEDGADGYYANNVNMVRTHEKSKTQTFTITSEWQPVESTSLRVDYVHSKRTATRFTGVAGMLAGGMGYSLQPIAELSGEQRYALGDSGDYFGGHDYSFSNGRTESSDNISIRGKSEFGKWTLDYSLGQATGRFHEPESYSANFFSFLRIEPDMILPEARDPQTGLVTSIFGRRTGAGFFPLLVTQTGADILNDASQLFVGSITRNEGAGGQSRARTAKLELHYDAELGPLKYVEGGIDYKRSRARNRAPLSTYYSSGGSLAEAGLPLGDDSFLAFAGGGPVLRLASQRDYAVLVRGLDTNPAFFSSPGVVDPLDALSYTNEDDLAGYLQGKLEVGKLELIGGVRYSRVKVDGAFPVGVNVYDENFNYDQPLYDRTRMIVSGEGRQTDILPRILVNFRASERLVFRAGYYSAVARPLLQNLSSSAVFTFFAGPFFGPEQNKPLLDVTLSNPDLKPAYTRNFDFSAEYYDDKVGVLKLGIFYKTIDNLLENVRNIGSASLDGVDLPTDPGFPALPADTFIVVTRPVNNPDTAKIWGIEASVEKQLTFLPGPLSGLGIYLNYTYSDSSKNQPATWFTSPVYDVDGNIIGQEAVDFVYDNVPFSQSPKHSGTAGLTYAKDGFEGSLFYSYQARRIASTIGANHLTAYSEASSSLDLRAEYRFKAGGAD